MKKHILVLNRSFWPDVEATGQLLTELCEELAKEYKVTVIAGRSYYLNTEVFGIGRFYKRETLNGIDILRVRHTRFWKKALAGRFINWLTYCALTFVVALKIKPNVIIVCTDPPFLVAIAMFLSYFKSAPFIYNCNDLYPDVAIELGKIKRENILVCLFDYLNKAAFNAAGAIICLGKSMDNRIRRKGIKNLSIKIIPSFVDTTKVKPISKSENPLLEKFGLKNKFIIMHSGNIGFSQNFDLMLEAMTVIKDAPLSYLVFAGEGVGKEKLKEKINSLGLKNVLFIPYQPLEAIAFSLSMADLHIITLKQGMAGTIVPSKVYGIMATGRPYLAITDKESEPASLAQEYGCGLWAAPDNLEQISEKITWAINHPHELEKMGTIGRQLAETKFDKKIITDEWFKLLEGLNI